MTSTNIKQHDISDCGPACLVSIASYYKLSLPISKVRQLSSTDKDGTNVYGLLEAAKKMGFDAKGVKGDISCLDGIPIPAIAHLILNDTLQHYVVIYKLRKQRITIMDPALGKTNVVPLEEFKRQWTGVLVILLPNKSFIPGNQKISLSLRFWYLLKPHKYILIQAIMGSVFYTILGFSTSIFIQKITDHVLVNQNYRLLNIMGIAMVFLLIFQILLNIYKDYFLIRTGQEIDARLILGYYKHILKLPQQFFDTMRIGEIISRINDAVKIRVFINNTSLSLMVNLFIVVFSFALMFTYYWKLGLIMITVIPLYALIYYITDLLNKKTERQLMESSADLESQLVESLSSISTIKQFGLENYMHLKTERKFITLLNISYKSSMNHVGSMSSTQGISSLFTIILLWLGSHYVMSKELTPGELFSFFAIIGYFTGPISSLISSNKTIQNAFIAADRLFEILDLETESSENNYAVAKFENHDIHFKNVFFSYGNRPEVFKNLNLVFQKGKITAIVGESGSGKSTLMHLLQGLYPLSKGRIMWGGQDMRYMSKNSLRNLIGIVPQEIHLFEGTLLYNIAIGDIQVNMERIVKICKLLDIMKFIESLTLGFETFIGENGVLLSGGQKQKIAIARALYHNPEVLILDEATSSLDSTAELAIKTAIASLTKMNKTVILITHRIINLSFADQIIILEDGKLVQQGRPQDLINSNGPFRNLLDKQLGYSNGSSSFDHTKTNIQ